MFRQIRGKQVENFWQLQSDRMILKKADWTSMRSVNNSCQISLSAKAPSVLDLWVLHHITDRHLFSWLNTNRHDNRKPQKTKVKTARREFHQPHLRRSHDFASLSLVSASTRILHSASVWKTSKPHTFSSYTHWIRKITIISVFHSATTADGRRKKTHQFLDCQAEPADGITSPCIVRSVRLTFSHCDPTPRNTAHPATELAIITARENKI